MSQRFIVGRVSRHSTASCVFKLKSNVTLCDGFSVLCIKLCIYMMLFVSNSLCNFIIYG